MTQKEELSIFLKNREIAGYSDLWIALAIFEAAEAIRELKNVLEVAKEQNGKKRFNSIRKN